MMMMMMIIIIIIIIIILFSFSFQSRSKLNPGNSCYHSVHSSSSLVSKNIKIKICRTELLTLPVVLYGCEICLSL